MNESNPALEKDGSGACSVGDDDGIHPSIQLMRAAGRWLSLFLFFLSGSVKVRLSV
jgi:hypothetical protein